MMSSKDYRSPWSKGWREAGWAQLDKHWDLIVIGGGITGAGIMAVAARYGLRLLLLEQADFGSGTSSRSSKMVHGGLRYLKHMQIKLTRESVQERQRLLQTASGLVEPLGFIYPMYEGNRPSPWLVQLGLGIYTHLASDAGDYQRLDEIETIMMAPGLKQHGLVRGFQYTDAQTDDARLVLRVLHDGLLAGRGRVVVLNYTRVTGLLKKGKRVVGVRVRDETSGEAFEARAGLIINASGAWADSLRAEVGYAKRLRPLRGSHLFFSLERFPAYQAIAFTHPDDNRPVFVFPWEGVTLVGTTDVDHGFSLDKEPAISAEEADYLLCAVQTHFPDLDLTQADVISTQAGVRPVVHTGKEDPSAESRDHVIWPEKGLLTVTGGKLTTFRLIAIDALKEAHDLNKEIPEPDEEAQVLDKFDPSHPLHQVDSLVSRRLWGRYGSAAPLVTEAPPELLTTIPGTFYLWAELVWSARYEPVCHLDDLLLRRFRFGILLPDGGQSLLPRIKALVQKHLGWNDGRWIAEVERYQGIWQVAHGLPDEWKKEAKGKK
jgi:glycerol-3-phosphate dehydrogenase